MCELNELMQERREIGRIIDDRSANRIPFGVYVKEYDRLTEEIKTKLSPETGTEDGE